MTSTFENKVALVTGAAMGMGFATAKAFAEAGATVVLSDHNADALGKAADELKAAGHDVLAVTCDVTKDSEVAAMVAKTVSTYGRLDAAFNNAGIQIPLAEVVDVPDEDYERVMAVNLRGVWNCMKHEFRQMHTQGSGAIGMTQSAALENAKRGIRLNAVCPGTIDTPMVAKMIAEKPEAMDEIIKRQPNGRLGRPEEVAAAVLFLCSDAASFILGVALPVDGGYTAN